MTKRKYVRYTVVADFGFCELPDRELQGCVQQIPED